MYSPEIRAELDLLRQKSLAGTITLDEQRRAVALLRDGRVTAAANADKKAKRATSAAAPLVSAADLLAGEI